MDEFALRVRGLTTRLKKGKESFVVVDHLSFDLLKGKTLAIVGESGSGKTMTALSIMRILPESNLESCTGEVIYQGENLLTLSEKQMCRIRGCKIAMIFQDPMSALNPVYTIGNQLLEVVNIHLNLFDEEATTLVLKALDEVGIKDSKTCFDQYPHELSGGMRQRVMIAQALISEPDILIADEPTTALDVTIQAQVLNLIRELQKKKGLCLLIITHDMGIVAEMADDVMVMYAAKSVEKGSNYAIFDHMAHPYTRGLFYSRPELAKKGERLPVIQGTVPLSTHFPSGCRFHVRCPYVMEKCKKGEIPEFSVLEKNHLVACQIFDGSLESQTILETYDI